LFAERSRDSLKLECVHGYFREAAELGSDIDQFNSGICCDNSEGSDTDFVETFTYFKQSSNQNYAPTQLAAEICLEPNRSIPREQNYAPRYFSLVIGSGIVIDNECNHIRRIENPIQVLSLSGS
jgi:hypothetical protein